MAAASTPAADKALGTAEILENILLEVGDIKTVWVTERVNKMFQGTIAGSVKLKRLLWILPVELEVLEHNSTQKPGVVERLEDTDGQVSCIWRSPDGQHIQTVKMNPLFCSEPPYEEISGFAGQFSIEPYFEGEDHYFQGKGVQYDYVKMHSPNGQPKGSSWRKMHLVRSTKQSEVHINVEWTGALGALPEFSISYDKNSFTVGQLADDILEQVRMKWGAMYAQGF